MTGEPPSGPRNPTVQMIQDAVTRAFVAARNDGIDFEEFSERADEYIRRGYTDVIAESVADGLERAPEVNRWEGGPHDRRVLDFGVSLYGGDQAPARRLVISVELHLVDPHEPP